MADDRPRPLAPLAVVSFAGGAGGATADMVLHSLDTVKTRLQSQSRTLVKYTGTVNALGTIIREEGLRRGLFAGAGAALAGSLPSNMLYFCTYETVKRTLGPKWDGPDALVHLFAGALGELAGAAFYVPSEVVKTRMQLQGFKQSAPAFQYSGLSHAVSSIYLTGGSRAFYAGFSITMFRDMPFSAIQFAVYEQAKRMVLERTQRSELTLAESVGAGAVAGAFGGALTTPLDVVKTFLHTKAPHLSIPAAFRHIATHEGPRGFLRGVVPRMLWTVPQGSILFFVYEFVVSNLLAAHMDWPTEYLTA